MTKHTFKITTAQSKIEWVGKKVTGSHNGTIDIKHGELVINDNTIVGGNFVVDMKSLKILDVTDPATNAQFAGHLASDDFFSIQDFPEASFEVTSVSSNRILGNLTIKDITHPVEFDAHVIVHGETLTAVARIVIDRTRYAIKFRSGSFFQNLGDTLIYNDFELNVNLTATLVNAGVAVSA